MSVVRNPSVGQNFATQVHLDLRKKKKNGKETFFPGWNRTQRSQLWVTGRPVGHLLARAPHSVSQCKILQQREALDCLNN